MDDLKDALLRSLGIFLIVLSAVVGAATCGDLYGQHHPTQVK